MSSEISNLQKVILRLAMERGGFVSSQEIISHVWGPSLTPDEPGYASGHASLSRSLNRLWARRLIDIFKKVSGSGTHTCGTWAGLTPEGEELARYLENYG